jgi:hypothetical protein
LSYLLFYLDVRVAPAEPVGWGVLIALLAVVLILSVGFAAGLVVLLIWIKRRKSKMTEVTDIEHFAN